MLPDRFFYPLAIIIVAAMILGALSFQTTRQLEPSEIVGAGWEMSGPTLANLTVSPGSEMDTASLPDGYVTLSQFTPDGVGPPSIGVFATLGQAYEEAFAGRRLRITIRARASDIDPLTEFDAGYYPLETRPSPWETFTLSSEWQDYTFFFTPEPQQGGEETIDLIAIFPGRSGEQRRMDLASIRADVEIGITQPDS